MLTKLNVVLFKSLFFICSRDAVITCWYILLTGSVYIDGAVFVPPNRFASSKEAFFLFLFLVKSVYFAAIHQVISIRLFSTVRSLPEMASYLNFKASEGLVRYYLW